MALPRHLFALLLFLAAAAALTAPASASPPPPPIHAYYFTAPLCPSCTKAENLMADMLHGDTQVKLHTISVYDPRQYEVADALLTVAGLPARELPLGPGLLVGSTYVNRGHFTKAAVLAALDQYRATGAPDITAHAMQLRGHPRQSLPQELRRWGLVPFLLAGLLDGINPCAFATLVFFLSYLGMMGTRGWPLLRVGLTFAVGVFAAYFAFGFGLLHALWAFDSLPLLRWGMFLAMTVASLVFAGLSWRDYRHLQRGGFSAVALQMPAAFKRQTHSLIRSGLRSRLLYPASFVMGAGVAALELACTGQVYVPALIYMMSLSDTRASNVGWLLAYDAMFLAPLLVLLLVVVKGTSAKRLQAVAEKQAAKTKLYLSGFFLLCAAYFAAKAAGM